MDNRIQRIFLTLVSVIVLTGTSQSVFAAEPEPEKADTESPSDIFQPKVERRDVDEDLIDSEDFEVGLFYGQLNIEDFGATPVKGLKIAYHVSEDFFINLTAGQAKGGLTSFEVLNGNIRLLTDEQREYTYYDLSVGWNALPGEAFVGESHAFNTQFYLIAGVGNTEFAGERQLTITVGAGYRFLFNDWLSFYVDTRDHMFNSDLFGDTKTTHNLEVSFGVSAYF
ncbi:outer membrane beta-barrel domain-containing protein [Pleionea sp. CnH1-48]|uniref:outer membrane beta-barrel domain-containing protein n=1 Tax=Pleionea sp. CnH1-48 TaxID=2954494 RepID=UPI002096CAF2|nr:outer membrane beta-barrel domain-containing protein [Pleionea sp. CnH1-48]MCO7225548.1 outer membrane beta-barrel domain-containing protein [Pleionea sp. CnH1-48]